MSGDKDMSANSKVCVITGTTGYLGSILKRFFDREGWEVRELKRPGFVLGEEPPMEVFVGAQVFIHCAYDFKVFGWNEIERVNIRGSRKLFRAAQKMGVSKLIHISSISAFERCESLYGKAKLAIEGIVKETGGHNIRPALIWGPALKGIFGNLMNVVKKLPIIPVIGSGHQPLYMVHEDDLANLIYRVSSGEIITSSSLITAASVAPMPFRQILGEMAKAQNLNRLFIPVPFALIYALLKGMEVLGLRPRLRSDGLIGLMKSNPDVDFDSLADLKLTFRPFHHQALRESP